MSLHGEIVTIVGSAAAGGAYPEFLPEQSTATEYIIVRRASLDPANTLQAYANISKHVFIMECWATNKARALAIADSVRSLMDADTSIKSKVREPVAGEDYAPEVMELMEPVQYGIWHA